MGIGMILVVSPASAAGVLKQLEAADGLPGK